LVRWPGVVSPGAEVDELVTNVDTFALVLGMLGVPPPQDVEHRGRDFSPLLRGTRTEWRDAVFAQYDLHNAGLAYMRMVRTRDWKLVRHHRTNFLDELYHLADDPGEKRNLLRANQPAAEQQAMLADLDQRLREWQTSIDDPLLGGAR
jgi:uncharacterized sulfatase